MESWAGLFLPAGTPAPIVSRLHAEITAALQDEAIKTSMRAQGVEPTPTSPEAFEAYIRSETAKWAKVIRDGGVKPD